MENFITLPILRSAYPHMTRSEKKIANYIQENQENLDKILDHTISELAKSIGSSEITISRFCKKLGFTGIKSLKLALVAEQAQNKNKENYQDIESGDSYKVIASKVFQNIIDGLMDTMHLLDFDAIEKAVEKLEKAHRILVYGVGNSATIAQDFETRFLRFGGMVHAFADSHQQVTTAAFLNASDVVVAISHSGMSKDILEAVSVAKGNGATIIAITSHAHAPLAKLADIVLVGMGREVHCFSESASSRFVHTAIVDILYAGVAMKNIQKYKGNIQKMRKVISKKK